MTRDEYQTRSPLCRLITYPKLKLGEKGGGACLKNDANLRGEAIGGGLLGGAYTRIYSIYICY